MFTITPGAEMNLSAPELCPMVMVWFFSDEAQIVMHNRGLVAFQNHEKEKENENLPEV